jgi:hypothetical protein
MLLAVFHIAWQAIDPSARLELPPALVLGSWILECVGLAALFLLVHRGQTRGRTPGGGGRPSLATDMLDGALTGWIAWVFRGPLLVLTLVSAGVPRDPWWHITLVWLILYTACGLLLGCIGHLSRPR